MAAPTPPPIATGTWIVDPANSTVAFAVKHMGIANVRGRFNEFEGMLAVADDLDSSSAGGSVRVASIDTGEDKRDANLRSPDFFDADRFPEIAFASSRIERIDDESAHVIGDLTMHGVTREVKLRGVLEGVEVDPWGNERVGLEIVGVLRRSDFGMRFERGLSSGNAVVGDRVNIALDISAVRRT